MPISQIVLIILSGLGAVHGLFLAVYLWSYKKGHQLSNQLLSSLLFILAFRVGKSVLLAFTPDIPIKLVFIGLGSMLAIGPLFYFFLLSSSKKDFTLSKKHLWHLAPSFLAVIFGFWINDNRFETLPKQFFVLLFLVYYLQFLIYLIFIKVVIKREQKAGLKHTTACFLQLLNYGLFAIWVVYFLNLLDDTVPYILGPIIYSLVVYSISFIVIKNGYIKNIHLEKYQTTTISAQQKSSLFSKVEALMSNEKLYLNASVNLKELSTQLNVTPQFLSMTINSTAGKNFNAYVNQYRIEEAKSLLADHSKSDWSISSIAFEVGFSSLSSFNANFKNLVGQTPASYRKSALN